MSKTANNLQYFLQILILTQFAPMQSYKSYKKLQSKLSSRPCLTPIDFDREFILTVDSSFKSTGVRQGLELSLLCNCSKAFCASSGRGPPFQTQSFRVSFVSGPAVWAKLSMVLRKKEQRPRNCQLFTESYIMEGQRNFLLSVDTFIEGHINVEELFNFSRLRVEDMASILQDFDLVGSTTGLTIQNIKDRYQDYSVEGTFVWVTRWVVVALTILGLGRNFWYLRKRYLKAKKDARPLIMQFRDLFSSDTQQPRDQEMQERGDPDSDENEEFIDGMTPMT
jgi:hypothetical protein